MDTAIRIPRGMRTGRADVTNASAVQNARPAIRSSCERPAPSISRAIEERIGNTKLVTTSATALVITSPVTYALSELTI